MKIPFAKVACDGNELKYVQEVLASGWLTTAGKALEFERRFAETVGARHACAVNSCTAALHLALEAIGIGPGDKVLVPTLTFTATAEVIRYLGADPVFVDVDYRTGLLTPEILDEALSRQPGIKAVMVVHFGGQAAQMLGAKEDLKLENLKPEVSGSSRPPPSVLSFPSSAFNPQVSGLTPPPSALRPQLSGLRSLSPGILDVSLKHGVKVIEDAAHAFRRVTTDAWWVVLAILLASAFTPTRPLPPARAACW